MICCYFLYCSSYSRHQKGFYVDGHERKDVVEYRAWFCYEYLVNIEIRAPVWIQVPKVMAIEMHQNSELSKGYFGYEYLDPHDTEMCEFHIDDAETFPGMIQMTEFASQFGGLLSKRIGGRKPIMIIGQDEAVTHEKSLNPFCWGGSGGQKVIRPKNLGMSYHFSGFTSRQFHEWNPRPTADQLVEINNSRRGESYISVDAANKVYGKATKDELRMGDHGFVRYVLTLVLPRLKILYE